MFLIENGNEECVTETPTRQRAENITRTTMNLEHNGKILYPEASSAGPNSKKKILLSKYSRASISNCYEHTDEYFACLFYEKIIRILESRIRLQLLLILLSYFRPRHVYLIVLKNYIQRLQIL